MLLLSFEEVVARSPCSGYRNYRVRFDFSMRFEGASCFLDWYRYIGRRIIELFDLQVGNFFFQEDT